jgi:hypothetical protein
VGWLKQLKKGYFDYCYMANQGECINPQWQTLYEQKSHSQPNPQVAFKQNIVEQEFCSWGNALGTSKNGAKS